MVCVGSVLRVLSNGQEPALKVGARRRSSAPASGWHRTLRSGPELLLRRGARRPALSSERRRRRRPGGCAVGDAGDQLVVVFNKPIRGMPTVVLEEGFL